ncbi:hypothetical protein Xsze_04346 [Xenorhabdus szentirmaii DSM 16338]|nr:hypothetical protein Xsze_04346 [Xenorhabdus szentirmaii DSM 16338]
MPLIQSEPQTATLPLLSSGKMCRASCPATIMPSAVFLRDLPEKMNRCSHQGKSGQTQVMCLDPKETSHGGYSMLNISAWPNDGAVCLLSQVLEKTSVRPRYFLSQTACEGILRRAEHKGKSLPDMLHRALQAVAKSPERY